MNCCHVSWVLRLGVVVLSQFPDSVSSSSAPPSFLVLDVDGLRMFIDESGCGMLGRTVFVLRVTIPWATRVCTLVVAFHEFSFQFADDEIVSWCGRHARASQLFSCCDLDSGVRGHPSVPFENGSQPTAGDPELTEDVALDFFACNYEDNPVTRRDGSDTTPSKLAISRWIHCSRLMTLRWRNTGVRRMPFTSSCRG